MKGAALQPRPLRSVAGTLLGTRRCIGVQRRPAMSERNRTTTALFVGVTAVVLMLALPVEAQIPSQAPAPAPSGAPVLQPQDTVSLTMEQRHIIKEIIVKDMQIT